MLKKLLATGALTGALILAGATGAVAYTGDDVQSDTVAPGSAVTFTSEPTGLDEGTEIAITVDGPTAVSLAAVTTGTTTVGADGLFSFDVTVPADAPAGAEYTGSATGTDADSTYTLAFEITVAAAPADGAAPGLPVTGGADTSAVLWFGAGALVLGGAAVAVAAVTRRKSAQI